MIQWLIRLFRGTNSATTAALTPSGPTTRSDTEFSAEIVRITQILPHGNADKLEIARFEMRGLGETTYEVVVQKGTAKPGDLMAYFSVDCVLPTTHPDFKFLAHEGRTTHRLKAARLRGRFSQGLLVHAGNFLSYGDSVAALFGVTYYQPLTKGDSSPTTSPGNGNGKSKAQPMPVYSVESLKKCVHLFAEGEQVAITEKIHGTNFRFGWVRRRLLGVPFGWKFVIGSHRCVKGSGTNHRYGEDLWLQAAQKMSLAARTRHLKGRVFYGELYGYSYSGVKIQDLTYGRAPQEGPGLVIFDIRDVSYGRWLDAWERMDMCLDLDLPMAPILSAFSSYYPGLESDLAEGKTSVLDKGTVREGVVIEALSGARRKAKWVSQAYLLRKDA